MLTSKTHWCMLKISGQIFRRNKDICIASKYLHQTIAMVVLTYVQKFFGTPPSWMWAGLSDSIPKNRLWKGRNSNFTLEKTDRHQLNQAVKVKSPVISHFDVMYPPDMTGRALLPSLSCIHNPRLFMRKYRTNQNSGTFYKILDQYSLEVSRSRKSRKTPK